MVSDFAVFLTIFTMVIIDFLIGVPSPKLQVPSVFKVNRSQSAWCTHVISYILMPSKFQRPFHILIMSFTVL